MSPQDNPPSRSDPQDGSTGPQTDSGTSPPAGPQDDPQASPMTADEAPPPRCIFLLFGATGDLAARKIAPALYNLYASGHIGDNFAVIGIARRERSDEQFRDEMFKAIGEFGRVKPDPEVWKRFSQRWHYRVAEAHTVEAHKELAEYLRGIDRKYDCGGSCLFYLAYPPDIFGQTVANLAKAGLGKPLREGGFMRLVVEKPFGSDLESARALNAVLLDNYEESQVYRIDHYLGKETAQNLMVFRFANAIWDHLFDRKYVDRVEITTAEKVGMEGRRGPYYESVGAVRDMIQNHMLQLMALVAMDAPGCIRCDDIREQKARLLASVSVLTPQEVARWTVRGQYAAADDQPAYRQESGVAADSTVETYAAIRLFVENKRWSGVPFYLRTGKELAAKTSQIVVVFKREEGRMLEDMSCELRGANRLCIRINPDEGIYVTFDAKLPGVRMMLRPVRMDFRYGSSFESASPEAYEQLLLDAARGDPTLFIRNDEVEASWRVIDSIRNAWQQTGQPPLEMYKPGSWGPQDAERIFNDPYKHWQAM